MLISNPLDTRQYNFGRIGPCQTSQVDFRTLHRPLVKVSLEVQGCPQHEALLNLEHELQGSWQVNKVLADEREAAKPLMLVIYVCEA